MNKSQNKYMKKVLDMYKESAKIIGLPICENPLKLKAMSAERLISAGMEPDTHKIINRDKLDFIIESYKETREPIVVLSHYRSPLFELQRLLKGKEFSCDIIHGTVGKPSYKDSIVQAFSKGEYDIFLGQTRSCKYNYNLSRASKTFYLTNSYSRDDRAQSEKRTTNLAKKDPVEIMDLCYKDTMDGALVKKLKAKEKISYSFIDVKFEEMACK